MMDLNIPKLCTSIPQPLCDKTLTSRTSDSLNEGLPIKMAREKFKENNIFSMKKIVGSTYPQKQFSLDKYQLKNMG